MLASGGRGSGSHRLTRKQEPRGEVGRERMPGSRLAVCMSSARSWAPELFVPSLCDAIQEGSEAQWSPLDLWLPSHPDSICLFQCCGQESQLPFMSDGGYRWPLLSWGEDSTGTWPVTNTQPLSGEDSSQVLGTLHPQPVPSWVPAIPGFNLPVGINLSTEMAFL